MKGEKILRVLIHKILYKWPDPVMDGYDTAFTGGGFQSTLKVPFLEVHLIWFHGQEFLKSEAGINIDQFCIYPWFIFDRP